MGAKLHLHSMMVHAVAALLPVAAAAWVLGTAGVTVGRFGPEHWDPLAFGSLVVVLLVAIPSTVTGVGERNQMYARWHTTHKLKLTLSLVLLAALLVELATLLGTTAPGTLISWLGLLIVVVNNGLGLGLCSLGLKITLGRHGVGSASYTPDMYQNPPVDILQVNAGLLADPPRTIDPSTEGSEP